MVTKYKRVRIKNGVEIPPLIKESATLRKYMSIIISLVLIIPFVMVIAFNDPLGKYAIWLLPLIGIVLLLVLVANWETYGLPKEYKELVKKNGK